ncbi:MAG: hypothetical protein AB7S71_21745 [Dongiaceae bacterium]
MSDRHHPQAGREFIGRTIQLLMLCDLLIGLVLVALGLFVYDMTALVVGGAVLAVMGLGLAALFRILARRADPAAPAGQPPARRQSPHQRRR